MRDPAPTERYHAFARLVLTVSERSLEAVHTDHAFELRGVEGGAEVWRSSVLYAGGESCASGERFVGTLTSRQVIELLDEIERSGIYEALPTLGLVPGPAAAAADPDSPASGPASGQLVSMRVVSATRERVVLDHAPADRELVHDVTEAVRRRVELAMERALTCAG